jgi:hypothetical protein
VGLAGLAVSIALGMGCEVDDAAFQSRVFQCNNAARDPRCGKDETGKSMTCFPASQLDGTDFCTASCDEPMSLPGGEEVCVQGNARLRACNPADATTPEGPCGRSELGCLRTDVTTDEGVCVTMEPCTEDAHCPSFVRSTCAATFLEKLYAQNYDLHLDHLYCLQQGCVSSGASCGEGQSCLPKLVAAAAHPPDICVPNCDSKLRCPPNHFCFRKVSGEGSPAICLPGLLGFLCETDVDCMVGRCESDEEPDQALELKLCTVDCIDDTDCAKFDSDQGKFVCHRINDRGRCATPDAYRGARCYTDADCTRDEGTSCVFAGRPTLPTDQGTCSRLCGPDATCTPRGGFGHVCLSFTVDRNGQSKPGCYPGYFPLACKGDDDCVGDLTCRNTGAAPPSPAKICTTLCQTNTDCQDNRWTPGSVCAGGICVPLSTPVAALGEMM